jgi:hypothetical protein
MSSPAEKQQESAAPEAQDMSIEEQLSVEFDRLESELEGETEVEEAEQTEGAEVEASQEVEAVEDEEVSDQEAIEEQQEAEDSGYTEPAPERWPDEMKTVYNDLPPEARKLMMEQVYKPMQRTYTQSTQELSQMRKAIDPMLQSMAQYQNDFERMGVNPHEAFRTQMAWAAHFARVGPQQGMADMQAAYGMDTAPAGQQAEEYLTPVERQLKSDLDSLKQQLGQTSQQQQSWQEQQAQAQQQAYVNGVQSELHQFINQKKEGKLAHPHVEKVAPAIAGIIRGGLINKTDDYGQPLSITAQMEQAYNMACRLDPSISVPESSSRQKGNAIAAQNAGVVAKNPAGETDVPELTMSEYLDQEYDRLSRRTG